MPRKRVSLVAGGATLVRNYSSPGVQEGTEPMLQRARKLVVQWPAPIAGIDTRVHGKAHDLNMNWSPDLTFIAPESNKVHATEPSSYPQAPVLHAQTAWACSPASSAAPP